jgi:hypothetical protein
MTAPRDNPQSEIRNLKSAITDSHWFWVLAFSIMALLALVAIGGKYGRRQANMEVEYQARERIAELAADHHGNNSAEDSRTNQLAARRAFASPGNTLVPIWPLAAILLCVALFATFMLIRGQRLGPRSDEILPP